uniref:Uncharacterized protein n=1 Tax=Clastoptera arizonana TaxID=38151 RepID=A0A1B6DPN8_9HEMI
MFVKVLLFSCVLAAYTVNDISSYNTAHYLANVASILKEQLEHPDPEDAKLTCSHIEKYNWNMREVLKKFDEKDPKMEEVVRTMCSQEVPEFTRFSDLSGLKSTYRWGSMNVQFFVKMISETDRLWRSLRKICIHHKFL